MAFVAKLTHGSDELDLNTGLLKLGIDWVPPAVQLSANLARGSSANRFGGSSLVSTRASNRTITVPVVIEGTSEAEVRGALQSIAHMLSFAGDELYFEFNPNNNVGFEPLWGQFGANYRYEVVFAESPQLPQYPYESVKGGLLPRVNLVLNVKPYALGLQQRVGSATGGILEDTIGTVDGISRGTIIPEATTNKMTNPIFGHATYDNGWTTTSLTATEITAEKLITHGKSSVRLLNISAAGLFTQSINVGNTNAHKLSCYAKLPDGSAVTSTEISLYYDGSAETTTFLSAGNGWYRLTADITGVNAATTVGVTIGAGFTVYVDGFQIEEKIYVTPLAHGDMLGCAWTGTAHASTTDRTVARLRVDAGDSLDVAEGTVVMAVKWAVTQNHPNNMQLWSNANASSLRANFGAAANTFGLNDNTNSIVTAAVTFAIGDIDVFHFVYMPGSLKIYRNGTEVATGSTYTPPTIAANLYLGSTEAAADQLQGTIMLFTTFPRAMTATEVSDDHANILEQVEDDRRLSPIPWLWTKDGDDVVDNNNDADDDNYCVIAGIPGSAPARTLVQFLRSATGSTPFGLFLSNAIADEWADPADVFWKELQGTVDAGSSEGEYGTATVGTSDIALGASLKTGFETTEQFTAFANKDFYIVCRLKDAGSDLTIAAFWDFTGTTEVITDYKPITTSTDFEMFFTPALRMLSINQMLFSKRNGIPFENPTFGLRGKRTTGSADADIDFYFLAPRPVMFLDGFNLPTFFYDSEQQVYLTTGTGPSFVINEFGRIILGDRIEFVPGKYNTLQSLNTHSANEIDITDTLTYSEVFVTPRWALL